MRKALSGILVPSAVTTVALRQPEETEQDKGKLKRNILDEEEYIEVRYLKQNTIPNHK